MAIGAGLVRRGAVYYWRKRLPESMARRICTNQLRLSLRTKDLAAARYLGAGLNAKAADIMLDDLPTITRQQLSNVLVSTLEEHARKLGVFADFSRNEPGFDAKAEAAEETALGCSYRLLAKKGPSACLDAADREELSLAGIDPALFGSVEVALERMKTTGEARPSRFKFENAMTAAGIALTAATVAKVEPVYLRALAEALLDTRSRNVDDPIDFGALATEARARAAGATNEAPDLARGPNAADLSASSAGAGVDAAPCVGVGAANLQSKGRGEENCDLPAVAVAPSTAEACLPRSRTDELNKPAVSVARTAAETVGAGRAVTEQQLGSVETIGAKLIAKKTGDKAWDVKTARQARMIFALFGRFLSEERGVYCLGDLTQKDLDGFDEFLRGLFKSYGKSPADKTRSVAELMSISLDRPLEEQGLSGATRNRHLMFIGQLLKRARAAGVSIDPHLELPEFRAKTTKRARNARPVPKQAQIQTFFESAIFTGCRGWNDMQRSGDLTFHRAAYFGPMLATYHGMRREEFCGLAVTDVVQDIGDHPYLDVRFNAFRRLKNLQSVRSLALHPELVRLGFLEYVEVIRNLGYNRLFPDFYSPTTKSPLGDRLHDELLLSLKNASPIGAKMPQSRGRSTTSTCIDQNPGPPTDRLLARRGQSWSSIRPAS